jgi:hypothetical protein
MNNMIESNVNCADSFNSLVTKFQKVLIFYMV